MHYSTPCTTQTLELSEASSFSFLPFLAYAMEIEVGITLIIKIIIPISLRMYGWIPWVICIVNMTQV